MARNPPFVSSSRNKSRIRSSISSRSGHTNNTSSVLDSTESYNSSHGLVSNVPDEWNNSRSRPRNTQSSEGRQIGSDGSPENDTLHEIIMAVNLAPRGTVGCCYYVAEQEKLFFMEDIEFGSIDVVDSLTLFIDPTVILLSTKVDDNVIDCFDPEARSRDSTSGDNDQFRLPYLLEIRPPGDFSYEAAKSRLANLSLGDPSDNRINFNVPGELVANDNNDLGSKSGHPGQLLRLAGWIDMESRVTIGCAGAVISYLQRRRASAYLPGDQSAHLMFRISTVEMFSLRESMFVNADTLRSLQILDAESHPNSHNRGPTKANSGAKEGLSVYGLFHHLARTTQGRFLLRQQFVRPSLNLDVINERLDAVEVLVRPENETAMQDLVQCLKNIGNMRVVLINLRKGIGASSKGKGGFSKSVWKSIRGFTFHALKIMDALRELDGGENLVAQTKVFEKFNGHDLARIGKKIIETVDFDNSAESSQTVILPNVDEELDHMKRTLDGLEPFLNTVATKLCETMPTDLRPVLNVIYFPQIGFLVTVPMDSVTGAAVYDGSLDNPWERMFSTEQQVYFKNGEMREMDDHFGDVCDLISDREIEISHELAQYVLGYEELMIECSDICGELDSLVALAQGAKNHKLCRPQLTLDNVIQIRGGRHILQELTVSSFIPNDTDLVGGSGNEASSMNAETAPGTSIQHKTSHGGESKNEHGDGPSMLIMTGPNYSGKSVYLKQVALIVLMAHVGSFVPAHSARIGLTDKILSRVTTRETVSRTQSAFIIDLQQISLALSLATSRSLLIIDEFGKGTEWSDGVGLACAVMEYLLRLGAKRPKVIGATHFHEIFEMGLLPQRPALAFGHMEVCVDSNASETNEQITYLYNFRHGRSTSSFGTCCAALNGVPPEIVERAENLVMLSMRGEDLVASCCQMPEDEAVELEEAEQIARKFLEVNDFHDPEKILADILHPSMTTESRS